MKIENGVLYVTGTPIGNLSDLTPRAVQVLSEVSFIAAEDTRVTLKLLNHIGISKEIVSCHSHNEKYRGEQIVKRLFEGESCALVSDAGMPAISDPGEEVVKLAVANGIKVVSVPAASAVTAALSISGLPTGKFVFEGFLSTSRKSRTDTLAALKEEKRTIVFYEAPHKLKATLKDLYAALGNRQIAICRELTKIHEQVLRFSLSEAIKYYEETPPKGEFVLIVEGLTEQPKTPIEISDSEIKSRLEELIKSGCSKSAAAKEVAKDFNLQKNEVYKLLI